MLEQNDDEHNSTAGVTINDSPYWRVSSVEDLKSFVGEAAKLPETERKAYWTRKSDDGKVGHGRAYLGTTEDRSSTLTLRDTQGRARTQLLVLADGRPEIRMLDEAGKVVKTVAPDR